MSVSITFVGDTWADVAAQMQVALGASLVFEVSSTEENTKLLQRLQDKAKDEPKIEAPAAEEAPKRRGRPPKEEPKTDDAKDETPAEGELDYERDIKPLVLEIAGKYGRDKVMELLSKYGVVNAGHVPQEDRPALMADIRAILAE